MIFIRDTYAHQLPFIIIESGPSLWASNNRIGNIPDRVHAEGIYRGWDRGSYHEQLYIKPGYE